MRTVAQSGWPFRAVQLWHAADDTATLRSLGKQLCDLVAPQEYKPFAVSCSLLLSLLSHVGRGSLC